MKKHLPFLAAALLGTALFFLPACDSSTGKSEKENFSASIDPEYSKDAVIFSLSFISNINEGRYGTVDSLQAQATRGVNTVLQDTNVQKYIGQWTPVWGPVTYTNQATADPDSCVSDNTMMLLQGFDPDSPSDTMYVLAIAGTIGASSYDWFSEDFDLTSMVLWPAKQEGASNVDVFSDANANTTSSSAVTDTGRYISAGVCNGLNVLFNEMTSEDSGQSLMAFLQDRFGNSASAIEIAVAGHSLGGALSPCVALSLLDNQSYWNPAGSCEITCYATAGFSPGNSNFASYFTEAMDSGFHGACNNRDVAIHAFEDSTMALIWNLYDTTFGSACYQLQNEIFIQNFFSCFTGKITQFGYTSLYSPANGFYSSVPYNVLEVAIDYDSAFAMYNNAGGSEMIKVFNTAATNYGLTPTDSLFARTTCFGVMTIEEHVNAYISHFGVGSVYNIYKLQLAPPVPVPQSATRGLEVSAYLNSIFKNCLDLQL